MTDSIPTRARGLGQIRTTITDTQEAAGKGEPGKGWVDREALPQHCPSAHHLQHKCRRSEGAHSRELWGDLDSQGQYKLLHGQNIRFKASLGIIERVLFITTQAFLCQ